MVIYCTNCGTKLEDEDVFCMNCGIKIEKNNIPKKSTLKLNNKDKKKAKKQLKKLTGGFLLNKNFTALLDLNHLSISEGMEIKKQLSKEIEKGQIKSDDVGNRLNEILYKYSHSTQLVNEFLKSKEIKSKIIQNHLSKEQVSQIEYKLTKKVRLMPKEHLTKEEVNKLLNKEFIKEINKAIQINKQKKEQEEKKKKEIELNNNRFRYINKQIKESCPDIQLASFEKKCIDSIQLNNVEKELNEMAKHIINTHKKIGKYDFAGKLIEEGGFTNKVDIVSLEKHARKDSDYLSYVFLKIFENNIKIVGSKFKPIYISLAMISMTPKYKCVEGKDRTIFFKDITSIGYSNEEIQLILVNNEKLILNAEKSYNKNENIEKFYNSLNSAWEKFKNNENEKTIATTEKTEISAADELMKYAELYEKGLLTEEEFDAMKKKLLGI